MLSMMDGRPAWIPSWLPWERMETLDFWLPLIIALAALGLLLVVVRLVTRSFYAERLGFERRRFQVYFEEKLRFERKRRELE